jgi:hypothetical protein
MDATQASPVSAWMAVSREQNDHPLVPRCGLDWRLDRVYFLAFLNPLRGQPDPALTARLASLCHRRWPSGGA